MPLTDTQRAAIIAEAKDWFGTPYRGWSCLKGNGADCGQLIYGVFRALDHVPVTKLPRDYSLQISKHRASTEYVELISKFFREIPETEVKPADLVVYKLGLAFAHAAIIVEWPRYIIQAVERSGVSAQHGVKNPTFQHAARKFFTLKDEYCNPVLQPKRRI